MKYGVLITTTATGAWSVSQVKQVIKNGEFTRVPNAAVFIPQSNVCGSLRLLESIEKGLKGKIKKTQS